MMNRVIGDDVPQSNQTEAAGLAAHEIEALFAELQPTEVNEHARAGADPLAVRHERQQRMNLLKNFFSSSAGANMRSGPIPTSSSAAELAQHRQNLEFRLECLRALVAITESELAQLARGQPE